MSQSTDAIIDLRRQVYDQRQVVNMLQRALRERGEPGLLNALAKAQAELQGIERDLNAALAQEETTRIVREGGSKEVMRGPQTTGLRVEVLPRMEYVPTAIYHLLNRDEQPLVECRVSATSGGTRRMRIVAFIEGYTARAIETVEFKRGDDKSVFLLPTLFPDRARRVRELTQATLNVLAEDLDNGKVEVHITTPVWLLSRNAVPLQVRDPGTGEMVDLARCLGAFVTPNQPEIIGFLRQVTEYHPDEQLTGYTGAGMATSLARAVFDALKFKTDIAYVDSTICFNPDEGAVSQRVRLPRESLAERQANCLDGALLFASLLEAMSLNPAIVLTPGHALVGWQLAQDGDQWAYLDTTLIRRHEFDKAVEFGRDWVQVYEAQEQAAAPDVRLLRRLSVRDLRTRYRITPME